MKARGPGSGWLAQNYDRLAFAIALALLLISTALLIVQIAHQRHLLKQAAWEQFSGPRKEVEPVVTKSYDESLAALSKPFQVPVAAQRMAVGELRVSCVSCGKPIPYEALECPFCKAKQPKSTDKPDSDGDSIPDEDENRLGLNPMDPSDATADRDGDRYSNIEEFKAGTDLNDPNSRPTSVAKIRLVGIIKDPFRLRFLGITKTPGGDRFQLNVRTLDRTYFRKVSETVEGFTVVGIDTNAPQPTLVLKQDEKVYRLVQGRIMHEDSLSAVLYSLLDGSRYRVRVNDEVRFEDQTYKVVDIKDDAVVVRSDKSAASVTIPRLSEEERQQIQQGGALTPQPFPPFERP